MKVEIIAEAGVNHNGDLNLAKQLVEAAAMSGADYVKFQTFKAEKLVNIKAKKAAYQIANTGNSDTQLEMLKKLELSEAEHDQLIDLCKAKGIKFLSTGFDPESIDYLTEHAKVDLIKIPSGEVTNKPYLKKCASKNMRIVMSTGMCTLEEVREALQVLVDNGTKKNKITLLHCNTEYPTPIEDVNLLAMNNMQKELGVSIGYSDHTLGIEIPIAAVALGATVIEKHFTLDRNMEGPDHKASLEPNELKAMVSAIRNIEKALGNGVKKPSPSEKKNRPIVRKSLVAKANILKGEIFTVDNVTVKRPGTGKSPMLWDEIIGTKATKDYKPDEIL